MTLNSPLVTDNNPAAIKVRRGLGKVQANWNHDWTCKECGRPHRLNLRINNESHCMTMWRFCEQCKAEHKVIIDIYAVAEVLIK